MVAIDDHSHAHARRAAPLSAGRIVSALFGAGLAAYGAARIDALPWNEAATALDAKSWPVAAAHVSSAALDEIVVPAEGGAETELKLTVSYQYEAAGRTYSGSAASLNDRAAAEGRRLVALYRRAEFARLTGGTVPVVYDPAEPGRAFMQADLPWSRLVPGLAYGGLLFLMAGWFFARAFAREPEREFHH